ncbi:MAG: tRNA (adenosine(37)-N6)-dimethylallyltransferase MiaA [Candidatus Marinimicrobia bacterium CG08_land_8_20_14_0_20_45_22]|nr:MAG: tRNA (adenosine(37)-N6)-dimethylallyltransferase MiaA [Candidatus Marinimicrobia bacterium CG08_land_8_20_14_0_20_45_22]
MNNPSQPDNPEDSGSLNSVIFIVGATAVGKTATAIQLAKLLDGEIISADSRQVYRGMDVGTAKPTLNQLKDIPHHLIDLFDPDETVSAGMYRTMALETVADIQRRNRQPIFVGGSGLYIRAIQKGIFKDSRTDTSIRDKIHHELNEKGVASPYNRLMEIDPETAVKIHLNDSKRISRALEIFMTTGKTPSQLYREQKTDPPFNCRSFVLDMPREYLYRRIDERVDQMISDGLVAEVQKLLSVGFRRNLDALMTLGYREVIKYLDGECSHDEMIAQIKQNTRHYAKRQITWFRNQIIADWISVSPMDQPDEIARRVIDKLTGSETTA